MGACKRVCVHIYLRCLHSAKDCQTKDVCHILPPCASFPTTTSSPPCPLPFPLTCLALPPPLLIFLQLSREYHERAVLYPVGDDSGLDDDTADEAEGSITHVHTHTQAHSHRSESSVMEPGRGRISLKSARYSTDYAKGL